jgi:hypothetical protein
MPKKKAQTANAEVQTEEEPKEVSPCTTHPICRVENSLFAKHGEAASPQLLMQEVAPYDLHSLNPKELERIQHEIGKAVVGDSDVRWIQLYVGLLLRGADLMEHSALDNDKAQEWIHRVGMAVVQAKAIAQPLGGEVQMPVWALVVLCSVVLVLVVLMITFFGVVLQELLHKRRIPTDAFDGAVTI